MKKKFGKKLLGGFMSLALVVGLMPSLAFAEDEDAQPLDDQGIDEFQIVDISEVDKVSFTPYVNPDDEFDVTGGIEYNHQVYVGDEEDPTWIYCMQHENLWPVSDGLNISYVEVTNGDVAAKDSNGDVYTWKRLIDPSSSDKDALIYSQIQKLLYAGAPYDSEGIISSHGEISILYGADITQHVLWSLLSYHEIEGNNPEYDESILQNGDLDGISPEVTAACKELFNFAISEKDFSSIENSKLVISHYSDNPSVSVVNGVTELLSIHKEEINPVFNAKYNIKVPSNIKLLNEAGNEIPPILVDEGYSTYSVTGYEKFSISASDELPNDGVDILLSTVLKVPSILRQFATNEEGWDRENNVNKFYQEMLSVNYEDSIISTVLRLTSDGLIQPGTTPDQPGTTPDQPGTTPDQPGTTPDQPGTTPSDSPKDEVTTDKADTKTESKSEVAKAAAAENTAGVATADHVALLPMMSVLALAVLGMALALNRKNSAARK